MLNKLKFILDIGSSANRLIAVSRFGKKMHIVAEESALYDGYMDGEFLSNDDLIGCFSTLIDAMKDKTRQNIGAIVVGVPSEFCVCVCKRISRKFVNMHKITEQDIQTMFENNNSFGDSEQYVVVNYSAMQYILDDNFKTDNPVGKKSTSLVLDASYILVKKSFVELITQKLNSLGVNQVDFISTALGQAMNCPVDNLDKLIAVVDVGHISTSVCVKKGEGLALLSSFSMGGGHISSDIMQVLGLPFKDAELIKRKVILTVESSHNESYEVCTKGNIIKAPINIINQVVNGRIKMIAKIIEEILGLDDVFKDVDIYLTGDGIANFKGVKNILKNITGRNVYEYKNEFDDTHGKYQTSKYGLAYLADIVI